MHDSIRIEGYYDKEYADQVISIINKKYNSADELMNDYNEINEEYTTEKKGDVGRKSKKIKLNVYNIKVNINVVLIAAKNEKLAKEHILSLPPIYNRFYKELKKINNVFFESNESETKIIMDSSIDG